MRESGASRGYGVNPGGQCYEAVPTLRIGRGGEPIAGRPMYGYDTDARDRHPFGIVHVARKFPKLLADDGARSADEDQRENRKKEFRVRHSTCHCYPRTQG